MRHGLQDFQSLGPAFAAIGDHETLRTSLCGFRQGGAHRRIGQHNICMRRGKVEKQARRAAPIHDTQRIIIGAPNTSAAQQQIETGETRRRRCTIDEEFHGLLRLRYITTHQMPPGGQQRAAGNGTTQKGLLQRRLRCRITEQRNIPRGHAVRHTAEILLILSAQNAAPRHGQPKPRRQFARGLRRHAKTGAGRHAAL